MNVDFHGTAIRIKMMQQRWAEIVIAGDWFYNVPAVHPHQNRW